MDIERLQELAGITEADSNIDNTAYENALSELARYAVLLAKAYYGEPGGHGLKGRPPFADFASDRDSIDMVLKKVKLDLPDAIRKIATKI